MKIAILNNLYPPEARGGALKIAETMEKGLSRRGHEIIVITTSPISSQVENREHSRVFYLKSFYFYLNKFPLLFKFFWQVHNLFNFSKYFKIKKILKKEKTDLVITHNLQGLGQLTGRAIKKNNSQHIHVLHDIQLIHPDGLIIAGKEKKVKKLSCKIYSYLNKKLIGSPDCVISPSSWLMKEHKKRNFFPHSSQKIIPNPIDPEPKLRKEEKFEKFTLSYIGQIEKHKGIKELIRAFAELKNENGSGARLLVVGSGSLLEELKKENENNQKIEFKGWLGRREMNKIVAQSHCLVVPSICYENYPTAILEALGLGIPVIASRLGGIPEILKEEKMLFNPLNKEEIKEKIKKAISDYSYYQKKVEIYQKQILNSSQYLNKLEKIFKENKG